MSPAPALPSRSRSSRPNLLFVGSKSVVLDERRASAVWPKQLGSVTMHAIVLVDRRSARRLFSLLRRVDASPARAPCTVTSLKAAPKIRERRMPGRVAPSATTSIVAGGRERDARRPGCRSSSAARSLSAIVCAADVWLSGSSCAPASAAASAAVCSCRCALVPGAAVDDERGHADEHDQDERRRRRSPGPTRRGGVRVAHFIRVAPSRSRVRSSDGDRAEEDSERVRVVDRDRRPGRRCSRRPCSVIRLEIDAPLRRRDRVLDRGRRGARTDCSVRLTAAARAPTRAASVIAR